jgi:hypothetical protein
LRTVILGVTARRGIDDPRLGEALSDVVIAVYGGDAGRSVVGPADLRRALDWDAARQAIGCDSDSCIAEVASAMNAARLVSGTVDAVGDEFLVTLTELDGNTFTAVGRVQRTVRKDESLLLKTVREAADELRSIKGGNSGRLDLSSDPRGAAIFINNVAMGVTPALLPDLASGDVVVRLVRDDYDVAEFKAPIFGGDTTAVTAQLRLRRTMAEANLRAQQERYEQDGVGRKIAGGVGIGVGVVSSLVLLGGLALALNSPVGGGVVAAVGATGAIGGFVYGGVQLLAAPPPPEPEWTLKRVVTITPPKGRGEVRTVPLEGNAEKPADATR